MPLLELKGITKTFGGLTAVDSFDMAIEKGQIAGLIGPNGAGKSTAFNMITGVFAPTKGSITFNGENITGKKPHQIISHGIARCFQHTLLFMNMTVLNNILLGFHNQADAGFVGTLFPTVGARQKHNELLEQAEEIANFMGLWDRRNELAKNLPYGFQRALAVAIALATGPELLLLDEPATGINTEETSMVQTLIGRIRDEKGITVLLIEHDMKLVMGVCEYIHVLSFGKKIAEGSPAEICTNKEVIAAYLGSEYATVC